MGKPKLTAAAALRRLLPGSRIRERIAVADEAGLRELEAVMQEEWCAAIATRRAVLAEVPDATP
jgi:hypothetical protein